MKTLSIDTIRELIRLSGPCITIFLPSYRPGGQTLRHPSTLLRTFIQQAERELPGLNLDLKQINDLLKPLHAMVADTATDHGSHWPRAILLSPGTFETFYLREAVVPRCVTGTSFYLPPLLSELSLPDVFYALKISLKQAALFRAQFSLEPLAIPGKVSGELAGFLELNEPDHALEIRSTVGHFAGPRVRFSTATDRETFQSHLADYYRAIDHALRELSPKPVILVGVAEDTSLYRQVTSDPNLADGTIEEHAPDQEILERGYAILRAEAAERAAQLMAEKERMGPSRFTVDQQIVVERAEQGRIESLFLRVGADDETSNLAAVETIRHGGKIFALPAATMNTPAAAELRY